MRNLLISLAVLVLITVAACARDPGVAGVRSVVPGPPAVAETASPTPAPAPKWPALDREPELAIRLLNGTEVSARLLLPCRLEDGSELPAGPLVVRSVGDGFQINGRRVAGPRANLTPVGDGASMAIGSGKSADRFAGPLQLVRNRGDIELIEHVGLETWLAGVLPAEMNPKWPVEALVAQAIAARSYAVARWQARQGEDWHLVRGTADVAYDGCVTPSANVAAALERSRGLVLMYAGQAILARFHAASGGRTEDSERQWPGATLLDGVTPLRRFMPPVDDPASSIGARGLGWTATHQDWHTSIPLAEVGRALRVWSEAVPSRPRIGKVRSVRIGSLHEASGRVATVIVVHKGPGGEAEDAIDAVSFRLAVGAIKLRSLWWERCTIASTGGGQLVVSGHGFGHGVGLPQVSAWALAEDGVRGEDIVARYYPGAVLARSWR